MTERLYLYDSYLKEIDAKVVSTSGNAIVLDKTIFYPGGGGQPYDTGSIEIMGKRYEIVEMRKNQEIEHIASEDVQASAGSLAHCSINWQDRLIYMRYHTAIHIIDGVIERKYPHGANSTGSQIFKDRARVDFDMPEMNRELAEKILEEANKVVEEGHRVIAKELSKEEALSIENLARTEPGRKLIESLDKIRVIEIEGLDMQMDGGTHVANTKEVGKISLLKFENKGSHNKRIEIKLDAS